MIARQYDFEAEEWGPPQEFHEPVTIVFEEDLRGGVVGGKNQGVGTQSQGSAQTR